MHRFFISPDSISGDAVTLSGPGARQLDRVLRSRPGDQIVVLDNSGWEYVVTLEKVSPDEVLGAMVDRQASRGEPRTRLTLYQGVLKADRFEFVLQKGTELGVSTFVPMICAWSVPRMREKSLAANRYARWHRIITEAAEQSHRGRIPMLEQTVDFFSACDNVDGRPSSRGSKKMEPVCTRRRSDGGRTTPMFPQWAYSLGRRRLHQRGSRARPVQGHRAWEPGRAHPAGRDGRYRGCGGHSP